jgi:ring-1,2-phenylacetyl-CoA epoxidase subunit PaaD
VYSKETILALLSEVKDPEIPVLSIEDMGIITAIDTSSSPIVITITPTFVGCPALDYIQNEIKLVLEKEGVATKVIVSFKEPWTSDRISTRGKEALKRFGIGPPPDVTLITDLSILDNTECPHCGSNDTELTSAFGATLCRSIHRCHSCKETFEQFKPL